MTKILLNIDDAESKQIKQKAAEFGLTTSGYIRQILKDSLRKKGINEGAVTLRAIRKLIPVLAQAIGRTQNASGQEIMKLTQILLKEYDHGVIS